MRSKASLALIEQAVMVLVFALAAALCLRAFLWSDQLSRRDKARDRALLEVQTAAETLKHAGGEVDHALEEAARALGGQVSQGVWFRYYDQNWSAAGCGEAVYRLEARAEPTDTAGLRQARVRITGVEHDASSPLAELTVAWQGEVDGHG